MPRALVHAGVALPARELSPERADGSDTLADRASRMLETGLSSALAIGRRRNLGWIVERTAALEDDVRRLDEAAFRDRVGGLARRLRGADLAGPLAVPAFALVREAARRALGLRHYDVQLMGGLALLQGAVAEMETGEGKSLTATLAAATAALAGVPTHIVTVNDYLAGRDAEAFAPLYAALGLSVGRIVHGMTPEERRAAYGADVVYCCNKELAFDYLRDRVRLGDGSGNLRLKVDRLAGRGAASALLLRGLHFAIVDEADSVLVDEARTPLILSREASAADERQISEQALALAADLERDRDYRVEAAARRIELTPAGRQRLEAMAEALGGRWRIAILREELLRNALAVATLFHRDEHYIVRDGKVEIIDDYTGRAMPDRSWNAGIHQLVEAKEGLEPTPRKETLAQMTYQRFFRRYRRLAGMTGTAREIAGELRAVYRLAVKPIPTNRPSRRTRRPDRILPTAEAKWDAILARVAALHAEGRPVLLATRSVAASEAASRLLERNGLPHTLLNAVHIASEAEIVAAAGEPGRITIATNMAGRGTDIQLGPGVAEKGGLHVIMSERHDAGRIDRQLAGRCGRQGDPGSFEAILSLEDPLLDLLDDDWTGRFGRTIAGSRSTAARKLLFDRAQRKAERTHAKARRVLLRADGRQRQQLAFAGRRE